LRLALAMRGGVSLAVWIGGAFAEIDRVRRNDDPFVTHLLAATRFASLEVDILAGASAGGLNAALGGLAISQGEATNLRETWLDTADIDKLLTSEEGDDPKHRRSILNGDYFLKEVTARLRELAVSKGTKPARVEMFLAATIFGGIKVPQRSDPSLTDRRAEAFFHFRHLGNDPAFSDLVDRDVAYPLGLAARATASFPGAFEPVKLPKADYSGRLHLPTGADAPDQIRLYDGGVVDNIPVARVIRAAASAPATETVRRWIAFLHPSPTLTPGLAPTERKITPGSIPSVVRDIVGRRGVETLLDDLDELRAHNHDAELQSTERYSLAKSALAVTQTRGNLEKALGTVDGYCLYDVLDDPAGVLSWIPVGEAAPASALEGDDAARNLERGYILGRVVGRDTVIRPFARVARLAYLTIDWIRWTEEQFPSSWGEQRTLVYDILLVAQLVDSALARVFLPKIGSRLDRLEEALDQAERSTTLHSLVEHLGGAGESSDPDLVSRLDGHDRSTLVLLARGVPPITDSGVQFDLWLGDGRLGLTPDAGAQTASARLLRQLSTVCMELQKASLGPPSSVPPSDQFRFVGAVVPAASSGTPMPPTAVATRTQSASGPGMFDALIDHLGPAPSPQFVELSLLTVDVALAGMHRGRAVVTPRVLNYVRISGTAATPLADKDFAPDLMPRFTTLKRTDDGLIDPRSKLAGNQLANFSAFLSRRFRANDWMWGRMDAAAGLVEILLRPDHLARHNASVTHNRPIVEPSPTWSAVEAIVTCPIKAAPEMEDYATSATDLCAELWRLYGREVEAELSVAAAAKQGEDVTPDPLSLTRKLVTTRWHLEIFVNEAGAVLAQRLEPGDQPTAPLTPTSAERGISQATANLAQLMKEYEASGRLRDIWGSRQTSALGVRVARHTARAIAPPSGPFALVVRTALTIPLILAADAALLRGGFLIASSLLVNVILGPRLNGTVHFVILIVSFPAAAIYWSKCVKRSKPVTRRKQRLAGFAGAVALMGFMFGIVSVFEHRAPFGSPAPMRATSPWNVLFGDMTIRWYAITLAAASAAVAVCLVVWAKRFWAIGFTVAAAALMGWWAAVGSWDRGSNDSVWAQLQATLGSMWTPAVLLAAGVTIVVLTWTPEDRPINGADPPGHGPGGREDAS
jgi:predicted acylesterase/phospholipase RssA